MTPKQEELLAAYRELYPETHAYNGRIPLRDDQVGHWDETFVLPKVHPRYLSEELVEAMGEAHSLASSRFGDEGEGYEHRLELAYLLESEAFHQWLREHAHAFLAGE